MVNVRLWVQSKGGGEVVSYPAGSVLDMPERSYESPYGAKYPAGGLLRAARRRADLSQRDLARAAKIHPSTVGRIESGELQPSLEIFRRLMGAAGHYFAVVDD